MFRLGSPLFPIDINDPVRPPNFPATPFFVLNLWLFRKTLCVTTPLAVPPPSHTPNADLMTISSFLLCAIHHHQTHYQQPRSHKSGRSLHLSLPQRDSGALDPTCPTPRSRRPPARGAAGTPLPPARRPVPPVVPIKVFLKAEPSLGHFQDRTLPPTASGGLKHR